MTMKNGQKVRGMPLWPTPMGRPADLRLPMLMKHNFFHATLDFVCVCDVLNFIMLCDSSKLEPMECS